MRSAPWLLLLLAGCADPTREPAADADPDRALLGGDTTIFDDGDEAFNYPLRNLSQELRGPFQIGDGVFNRNWVTAPASVKSSDGLGPTYNAISCSACHSNDGPGAPPSSEDEPFLGLLLRLSVPGVDPHGGPNPDPNYGDQLNPYAILGVPPEGVPVVTYTENPGTYADGDSYSLRSPSYSLARLNFGDLGEGILLSPRLAPPMVGLGLLEAVSEETILGFAANNGGHPNYVWDVASGSTVIGRFGWKANQPNLTQQTFAAFRNDIGITSPLFPSENCPSVQEDCANAPRSEMEPNLDATKVDAMVTHALGLAVPARRQLDDPAALAGERLFGSLGCDTCHVPKLKTGTLAGWPELSEQTIRPFTDLLLHDMGSELADGRPDFQASGSEWRTPPLWGLGLVTNVGDRLFLLHDGRARDFAEAILWHGGEASAAREAFRTSSASQRAAVVAFLQSL